MGDKLDVAPLLPSCEGLDPQGEEGDSGLNHHNTKVHQLRNRQTFRLSDRGQTEGLNSCQMFSRC